MSNSRLKSFRVFTEERVKSVVVTFGRFNPPTIGHGKLLDKVASVAEGNNYRIYASQSNDPKKNPLSYKDKIKYMRKMFPKMGRNIIEDPNIKNILGVAGSMFKAGFTKLIVVECSDLVTEFQTLLEKYNGSDKAEYNFKDGIEVVSAGSRDPDSEDAVEGMSASKMRKAAIENDLQEFTKGLPKGFTAAQELFNAVRAGLGLKESYSFRKHIRLNEVSQLREDYVAGKIFNIGDTVESAGALYRVSVRGPNYLIGTNLSDNTTRRDWISAFRPL
jgi:hypothetical protein